MPHPASCGTSFHGTALGTSGVTVIDISHALAADLAQLDEGGDPSDAGLAHLVHHLADAASAAVESFLGLGATVRVGGAHYTAVVLEDGTTQDQVRTSVRVPLDGSGALVLLAGVPGALVDLAADLAVALRVPPGTVVLDQDLQLPDPVVAHRKLDDTATLNQAVGVLVARGASVAGAHAELVRLADQGRTTRVAAARAVLGTLTRGR